MKLYTVIPYSHKQLYAIDRNLKRYYGREVNIPQIYHNSGIQSGSGMATGLASLGSILGKIASNPAVQNIGKVGLEVGANIAGNVVANKLANAGYQEAAQMAQQVAQNPQQAVSSLLSERDKIKQMYKDGMLSKADAVQMLLKIDKLRQSGGVKNLKMLAKKQSGGFVRPRPGRVATYRPAVMPDSYNQSGGIGPLAAMLAPAGLALGASLLGGLVSPIMEAISRRHIAGNI